MPKKVTDLTEMSTLAEGDDLYVVDDTTSRRITALNLGNTLPVKATGSTTARTLAERFADITHAADFGVVAGVSSDQGAKINSAIDKAATDGGGIVQLPEGTIWRSTKIVLKEGVHLRGEGRGVTTIKTLASSDTDIIETNGFGTSDITSFGVTDLTLDGNYLDDDWNASTNTVNNSSGYGLKIQGYAFDIDVELLNIPEVGAKFNALASAIPKNDDGFSRITISGRICGKEGVIFKGPNDIIAPTIFIGLCGITKRPGAETTFATSTEYSGQPVDGIVIDGANLEVGRVHVFACYSGTGFVTRNTVRLECDHLITESNNGGCHLSSGTYGQIAKLSVRNVGLIHPDWTAAAPTYTQPDDRYDGCTLDCSGFLIGTYLFFRTITDTERVVGTTGLVVNGDTNHVTMSHLNSTAPSGDAEVGNLYSGDAIYVAGSSNRIVGVLDRVRGYGCKLVDAVANDLDLIVRDQEQKSSSGAAFYRKSSTTTAGYANRAKVVATGCDLVFESDSTAVPLTENFEFTYTKASADTLFSGTDRTGVGQNWNFYGVDVTTPRSTTPFAARQNYTISGGVITINSWDRYVRIDTESAAASDDLDTINGGIEGQIIELRSTSTGRDPTLKDGTGNLDLAADFILSHTSDAAELRYNGAVWQQMFTADNAP